MKRIFLAVIVSLIFFAPAKASHLMGGEITWKCVKTGPNQGMYIFQLKLYRDCNGSVISGTSQTIMVHNNNLVLSINVHLIPNYPLDISPLCDPVNSGNPQMSCINPQQGSVEEYIYESTPVNLPGIPPAGGWHFTWDDCCRNGAITNGFANEGFTLRAVMYPYSIAAVPQNTSPCFDSSPQFNEQPKTIICIGYPFSYSHNASDPELDSLVYDWADVLDDGVYNPAAPITLPFSAPYSTISPMPGNPTLNTATGEISYFSNTPGNFVTCVKVSAFKCGQLVAEVYREIQVVLLSCPPLASGSPNTPPVVQPPFAGGTSYFLQVMAGTLVNFNISGTDNDIYPNGSPQDLTLEVSGGQFASNFANNTLCANPPCATFNNGSGITPPFSAPSIVSGVFNWQTSCSHIASNFGCNTTSNLYTFLIKVVDDFCPAPAITIANITIEVSTILTTSNTACDSYTWNGTTYTTSGTYTYVFNSINGCDSTVTLNLTINYSDTSYTNMTSCDSVVWNGTTYTASGTYLHTTITAAGCDSIATLNLTVNNSSSSTATAITACDSYIWNGATYTVSGTYFYTTINAIGCDSISTLDLTINYSTSPTDTVTACNSYTWNGTNYTTSGTYYDSTFTNINGCDSIITLDLTITGNPIATISQVGLDLDASVVGGNTPYLYQWNTTETTQQITPTANGTYWVIVEDVNQCISDTIYFNVTWISTSINELNINNLSIYPNPSEDIFNITFISEKKQNIEIRIFNTIGERVFVESKQQFVGEYTKQIDLKENPKAIYFLEIETENGIINKKLILQ